MEDIKVIERNGKRVLTTLQIADMYGTTEKIISNNFNNNKHKYLEGKHYIVLRGIELKIFLQSYFLGMQNINKIRVLYLWTEKGALLHAKSINTDKAWEVYDYLVDHYFRSQEIIKKLVQDESSRQQSWENLVVNVPENAEIQKALQEVHRYLIAVDIALNEVSKYRTEEEHKHECDRVMLLLTKFYNKACDALSIKPKLVRKL